MPSSTQRRRNGQSLAQAQLGTRVARVEKKVDQALNNNTARANNAKKRERVDDLRTANRYEDGENSINSDMNAIKQPKALMAAKKAAYQRKKMK